MQALATRVTLSRSRRHLESRAPPRCPQEGTDVHTVEASAYIDWVNHRLLHSDIGNVPPAEAEARTQRSRRPPGPDAKYRPIQARRVLAGATECRPGGLSRANGPGRSIVACSVVVGAAEFVTTS